MPLTAVETPRDLVTTNQWVLEIEGTRYASFSTVNGFNRSVTALNRADGGTGIIYKFSDQKQVYGDLTFTRQRDPKDPSDAAIKRFVDEVFRSGQKYNGMLTKYHHGQPAFRIVLVGLLFKSESHPNLDKTASNAYTQNYSASVDFWEEVPS